MRNLIARVALVALTLSGGCAPELWPDPNSSASASEPDGEKLTITVDYDQPLGGMIAAGKYDWVDGNVSLKHFPRYRHTGKNTFTVRLVRFNRAASTSEISEYFAKHHLQAAAVEQLLAFGVKYPALQRQFPIVAFVSGSFARLADRGRVVLNGDASERDLSFFGDAINWSGHNRYLAIDASN